MEITAISQPPVWRGYLWPALLTLSVLGFAAIAGFIWRDGGFVTANILNLQGHSEGQGSSLSSIIPLGFAFPLGTNALLASVLYLQSTLHVPHTHSQVLGYGLTKERSKIGGATTPGWR